MGFVNWLKGAAGTVANGVSWLGNNVVRPVSDFLKKVPIVGDVVQAADPIGNAVQKSADYAADTLNGVPAAKRRKGPTAQEIGDGIAAIPKVAAAGLAAYTGFKGLKSGFGGGGGASSGISTSI